MFVWLFCKKVELKRSQNKSFDLTETNSSEAPTKNKVTF